MKAGVHTEAVSVLGRPPDIHHFLHLSMISFEIPPILKSGCYYSLLSDKDIDTQRC